MNVLYCVVINRMNWGWKNLKALKPGFIKACIALLNFKVKLEPRLGFHFGIIEKILNFKKMIYGSIKKLKSKLSTLFSGL